MKGPSFAVIVLVALAPLFSSAQEEAPPPKAPAPQEEAPPPEDAGAEGIAFRINGNAFTRAEMIDLLMKEYEEDYREILITRFLVEEEARKAGVDFAAVDEKVEKRVQDVMARLGPGSGPEALRQALRANGGLSLEVWKQSMRTMFLTHELLNIDSKPPEEEIQALFERTHGEGGVSWQVRHILAAVNLATSALFTQEMYKEERPKIEEEARAKATEILERCRGGEDFGDLAVELSDDRNTATEEKRGDLGVSWRHLGEAFSAAARSTPVGDFAGPIESNRGVHVIQVTGMGPAQMSAQHIFLNTRGLQGLPEEERAARLEALHEKAAKIVEEAVAGKDFAELATAYDDRGPRGQGGTLRTLPIPSSFGPDFDKAIGEMQPGEVRGPIEGRNGLYIVKLHEVKLEPTVRHILISTQFSIVREKRIRPILEAEAMKKIEGVVKALEEGQDFETLAATQSDDRATQGTGGRIENYGSQRFGPEFHAALLEMKPGDPPRIVKTLRHGVHLVELLGVTRTQLDDVRDELVRQWRDAQRIQPQKIQEWQEKLRGSAVVEIPGKE